MKKFLIILFSLIGLGIVLIKGAEWGLERTFEKRFNHDPNRAYDVTYKTLEFQAFFRGVTLNDVSITPLRKESGTRIKGKVDYASINGITWRDLLFSSRVNVYEIEFVSPVFEITLSPDTTKKTSGTGIQNLFGDILSRGDLHRFRIRNGSAILIDPSSNEVKGSLKRISISADEIKTDSVMWKYIIPFQLGGLKIQIDSIRYQLNDYTTLRLDSLYYSLREKDLFINGAGFDHSIDWIAVSKRMKVQKDIFDIDLRRLAIYDIEPTSNFYSDLEIVCNKIEIDGLDLQIHKNKNYDRPPDKKMLMFSGLVKAIPIQLDVDSIVILDSKITHGELGKGREEPTNIELRKFNGVIHQVTTFPELQKKFGEYNAQLNTRLNGVGYLDIGLRVPYEGETFSLRAQVDSMDLTKLNSITVPIAGVEIQSGDLKKIDFRMNANDVYSDNELIMDYENLRVSILNDKEGKEGKKRGLATSLANSVVRQNNLPENKKYFVAEFRSQRNIYRAPFQYIVVSLVEGMTYIVPGKAAQKIIHKKQKKANKKQKKQEKKKPSS